MQALFFRPFQASEGKRKADVTLEGVERQISARINACRVRIRGLLVARSGNLGSNKKFQDGGRQAWWSVFFFYGVSSISKVCSHCLFELQSSIVLFSTYHLFLWKLTYFFHGLSTLFIFHHISSSSYFIFLKNTNNLLVFVL